MTRVLVVDDSQMTRVIVKKALVFAGLETGEIAEAGDGQEALDLFATTKPDLILCDVNMPRMGGVEFLKALNERGHLKSVSVIMITSNANDDVKKDLLDLGAKDLIAKPFKVESLHTRLKPYLFKKRIAQQIFNFRSPGQWRESGDLAEVLDKAVVDTLEKMTFVGATRFEGVSAPEESLVVAEITTVGECPGTFVVAATRSVATELIAPLTEGAGEEGVLDDIALCDGIAEIANIIVGYFLDQLHATAGSGTNFSLASKSIVEEPSDNVRQAFAFGLDESEQQLFVGFVEGASP